MQVNCPYCQATVEVTQLADHVRMLDGDGHGPHGTTPVDHVDNPWNLRIDVDEKSSPRGDTELPDVEYVENEIRRGRCPACDRGAMALKGGDGFFSSGHRRLACPNCGWESPEWITIKK